MTKKNFQAAAEKRIGSLFENQEEIDLFSQAIVDKFEPDTPFSDLVFLSKILYTAHLLDLRRLTNFQKDKILKNISMQLFETEKLTEWESKLLDKLWVRSGDYLNATGDRDMDDQAKSDYDRDIFCSQAHNPKLLVHALQLARTKPEEKLLQSILAHTDAIRELKEKFQNAEAPEPPYQHTPEEQEKITQLREALKNAPYTASEAYLKILLGEQYIEIPREASEEIARTITTKNVMALSRGTKKKRQK
jgi:hypothetical protein